MQTFFKAIERLPPREAQAIRAAVPDGEWNDVDRAGPLAWLPVQTNLTTTHAVAETLGPRQTQAFFEALMLSTFETPLLKGFIAAVLRVAGRNPTLYLGWISRAFNMMFKNCGTWSVIESDPAGSATIQVDGLPDECASDTIWLQSVASSLHALYILAECDGSVMFRTVDPRRGLAVYRLRWDPTDDGVSRVDLK